MQLHHGGYQNQASINTLLEYPSNHSIQHHYIEKKGSICPSLEPENHHGSRICRVQCQGLWNVLSKYNPP